MIVELRTYRTRPGMRGPFLEIFRARTVPEHDRLGMPIIGPFPSIEDEDVFFFLRGFRDEASREATKARFYEGELWKKELEGVLMPMLESYEVVVADDADSLLGWRTP